MWNEEKELHMNLKKLRKKAGFNQVTAAIELGVTQSAVSQWESGNCRPRADLLSKMARLYRCTADEILTASEIKTEQTVKTERAATEQNGQITEENR
jgi:transcriptional regulator with XRE-family HTH domain